MTPEIIGKWPGFLTYDGLKYSEIPNGLGAIAKVPVFGWVQIFAYCMLVEVKGMDSNGLTGTYGTPGDFGFKVLTAKDEAGKTRKLQSELASGRLAMMAIIGMFFQDGLTGSAWGDWALYTGSPLRAFENELGVQAPVGYWDPLGLGKDGDADVFRRRRVSEIKHGRIAMIATIGYFVTGLGYRFPGMLSPSMGISFEGCPGGLEAINAVPSLGWAQWFIFCGLIDTGFLRDDPARA